MSPPPPHVSIYWVDGYQVFGSWPGQNTQVSHKVGGESRYSVCQRVELGVSGNKCNNKHKREIMFSAKCYAPLLTSRSIGTARPSTTSLSARQYTTSQGLSRVPDMLSLVRIWGGECGGVANRNQLVQM